MFLQYDKSLLIKCPDYEGDLACRKSGKCDYEAQGFRETHILDVNMGVPTLLRGCSGYLVARKT